MATDAQKLQECREIKDAELLDYLKITAASEYIQALRDEFPHIDAETQTRLKTLKDAATRYQRVYDKLRDKIDNFYRIRGSASALYDIITTKLRPGVTKRKAVLKEAVDALRVYAHNAAISSARCASKIHSQRVASKSIMSYETYNFVVSVYVDMTEKVPEFLRTGDDIRNAAIHFAKFWSLIVARASTRTTDVAGGVGKPKDVTYRVADFLAVYMMLFYIDMQTKKGSFEVGIAAMIVVITNVRFNADTVKSFVVAVKEKLEEEHYDDARKALLYYELLALCCGENTKYGWLAPPEISAAQPGVILDAYAPVLTSAHFNVTCVARKDRASHVLARLSMLLGVDFTDETLLDAAMRTYALQIDAMGLSSPRAVAPPPLPHVFLANYSRVMTSYGTPKYDTRRPAPRVITPSTKYVFDAADAERESYAEYLRGVTAETYHPKAPPRPWVPLDFSRKR